MIKRKEDDKMFSIRERGKKYQYCFESGKVNLKKYLISFIVEIL